MAEGSGIATDPWVLWTAPGSSTYLMSADPDSDPPALVCQVGSTTLRYHLSAVQDLHRWLVDRVGGSNSVLPTRRKSLPPALSRHGAGPGRTRLRAGTACAGVTAADSACTFRPCSRRKALPNSRSNPATTRSALCEPRRPRRRPPPAGARPSLPRFGRSSGAEMGYGLVGTVGFSGHADYASSVIEKAFPSGSRKANMGGTPGQRRISSVSTPASRRAACAA